jgi:hypothetical protein
MVFNGRNAVALVILGIVLLTAGCATIDGRPLWPLRIPPSRGDGEFHDISWHFPWPCLPVGMPVPGYVVKFPAFSLDDEYQAEYVVEDLHDIGAGVGVYLFVGGLEGALSGDEALLNDDLQKGVQAQFGFEVRDSQGRLVAHAEKPLGQLTWSTPSGVSNGHRGGWALYADGESFFRVHKGERYTIRIHYRPDPAFRACQGFVDLECGGSV